MKRILIALALIAGLAALVYSQAPYSQVQGNPIFVGGVDSSINGHFFATDTVGTLAIRSDAANPYSCLITFSSLTTTQCQAIVAGKRNL